MQIVLLDDDRLLLETMQQMIETQPHYQCTLFTNADKAIYFVQSLKIPILLCDINLPKANGIQVLESIKSEERGIYTDVIMMTGSPSLDHVVAALRNGAYDYVRKPIQMMELLSILDRCKEHQMLIRENISLSKASLSRNSNMSTQLEKHLHQIQRENRAQYKIEEMCFHSTSMKAIEETCIVLHKRRNISVLLEGETGVGKEVIAKLIHTGKQTTTKPFIALNCAAMTTSLFESELFGYEKGAFTGANEKGSIGKFELSNGGTLFLDEIGELSLELQSKLLRVLQEQEFFRVGGLKKIKTDVRIICASNQNLKEMVQKGTFRQDLFFRICVAYIEIPPLRNRRKDIIPMAKQFLASTLQTDEKTIIINDKCQDVLENYAWPGNIRELKNFMELLTVYSMSPKIDIKNIHRLPFSQFERIKIEENGNFNLDDHINQIIRKVLTQFDNNKSKTAEYLGITRKVLYRYIKNMED